MRKLMIQRDFTRFLWSFLLMVFVCVEKRAMKIGLVRSALYRITTKSTSSAEMPEPLITQFD